MACDTTKIVVGKTYKVTFDGVEYRLTARLGSFDRPYLGAYSTNEITEEMPFNVDVLDANTLSIYTKTEGESHTVTIELEQTIVPLANEYIPADYINLLIDQRLSELGLTGQS